MTPRTVRDGADISNLRQCMRAKWKIKWGKMHKMFLCQSVFWVFCFSLSSLCVSCYLSEWKASLSHRQACFLVVSVMRQSVNISWLWVGVNVLEKSLKTVKYKTKSMCISLSLCGFLSMPLVPHICPLFTAFLTPPQLRGFNWMWRHIKGGGGGRKGWSHSSGASRTSRPSSPQRQDCVSCQLRSVRMGSAKSAHASEYQVKNQVPPRRKKETS